MPYFFDPSEVRRRELVPGVTIRPIWGEKIMMSMVEIAPNAVVPNHTHPHEQAGVVLQGEFDFTIGGVTKRLKQGDAYVIPGGVEHYLKNWDGWSLALDIFGPPREEYKG
ncbi:MAG: cupin domain-containing protein [Chloroflexi bacterium]|nr:cupin domain-containing protein [Chloroflexota bacterium]